MEANTDFMKQWTLPKKGTLESKYQIVKSFMAHHQGMSLLAINNYFNDDIMIKFSPSRDKSRRNNVKRDKG